MDQYSNDSFAEQGADDPAASRIDTRDSLLLVAQFRYSGRTETIPARVRNLSSGGLMAEVTGHVETGEAVEVEVRNIGWVSGRIAWVAAGRIGIAFDHEIDPNAARKPVVTKREPVKAKPIRPLF